MRGRSPGALSLVYPATFPPSIRLIHLAGHHCPSLHGRSRSTSPQFSLYPGGASSKGRFVSRLFWGTLVRWRSSRASSSNSFSLVWRVACHRGAPGLRFTLSRPTACLSFFALFLI